LSVTSGDGRDYRVYEPVCLDIKMSHQQLMRPAQKVPTAIEAREDTLNLTVHAGH
jgi:hypothetical protein